MANRKRADIKCGTIDPGYRGVEDPKLEAIFLQTEAERAKYEPIMKSLQENGLPSSGTTISGI